MYKKYAELLERHNETTADVSRDTGIQESVFSNWKSRNGALSVDNLAKIAKHFNVPIEYFLETEEA